MVQLSLSSNPLPTTGRSPQPLVSFYGDIGTSVLYAIKEIFGSGRALDPDNVHGVLSIVVLTPHRHRLAKYVTLVLRADNHGEDGRSAMLALACRPSKTSRSCASGCTVVGIFGTCLFYGDGSSPPAILGAVGGRGLEVISPTFKKA